jgi:hemerythrin
MGHNGLPANMISEMESLGASRRMVLKEIGRVLIVPDAEFMHCYSTLVASVERGFADEEQAMENIDFDGLKTHREQHARVLSGLHHADSRVRSGDIAVGRKTITLLSQWMEFHLITMDSVLDVALQVAHVTASGYPCSRTGEREEGRYQVR